MNRYLVPLLATHSERVADGFKVTAMRVAIYLRKSRADLDAEARGEGETLAKHKKALLKLAKHQNLTVVRIYEEIVSGESLFHRPEMNELLKDVESNQYDAVLVMDIDRLGRGNMQEQGLILETFRTSNTKIITPRKTYDLSDEFDEEYSEFEAFMARKELKIINRRLQGGRVRSVEEGNYIGTRPPYGYSIHKEGKSRYLVPHPEQSKVVKLIFEWYTNDDPTERLGSNKIANRLNDMNLRSYTGKPWTSSSVLVIIKNAVYTGRIQWKKAETTKSKEPGKRRDKRTRPEEEWIDVQGKHEPLISEESYAKAKEILKGKYHVPYQLENGITNPLAGLIKCDKCGMSMVYRPYTTQPGHLMCHNRKNCDNKSARFEFVETKLIQSLEQYLADYEIEWKKHKRKQADPKNLIEVKKNAIKSLQNEISECESQKLNLFDLLERKIYTEEIFIQRSQHLGERIASGLDKIKQLEKELVIESKKSKKQNDFMPRMKKVLKLYSKAKDPAKKNALLKSVLHHATYRKELNQRNEEFTLKLFPRL